MKYGKEGSPPVGVVGGMLLVPLERNNPSLLQNKGVVVARSLQKERRRNKRREKENLWRRNNIKNALQEPVVMHYPAR